jgi:hypothetical protein
MNPLADLDVRLNQFKYPPVSVFPDRGFSIEKVFKNLCAFGSDNMIILTVKQRIAQMNILTEKLNSKKIKISELPYGMTDIGGDNDVYKKVVHEIESYIQYLQDYLENYDVPIHNLQNSNTSQSMPELKNQVESFKWIGTANRLEKLFKIATKHEDYDLLDNKIIDCTFDTFKIAFAEEPIEIKEHLGIRWLVFGQRNNAKVNKYALFYLLDKLSEVGLINEHMKPGGGKAINTPIRLKLENMFVDPYGEHLKDIKGSYNAYKNLAVKSYPDIDALVENTLS